MLAVGNQRQILIVDRDIAAIEPLRARLREAGFAVRSIGDGAAAIAAIEVQPPHLAIIDWNMPGFAALEVIDQVRKARFPQRARLIILSDLCGEHDVVSGLNLGADDYIAKPFSVREAVARVHAILRTRPQDDEHAAFKFDELRLDTLTNRVTAQGVLLRVRGAEYRLLEFLMSHPGRTFNRTQLLIQVWAGVGDIDERTVDVNVQRLRKILAEPGYEGCIQTVRGFGYRFAPRENGPVSNASQF